MNRRFLLLLVLTAVAHSAQSQDSTRSATWRTDIDAEIGLLSIENEAGDKESFFSTVLLPTFSKGDWAVGARIKFRVNQGGFRSEDYNSLADILSIARFVQFGEEPETEDKRSPRHVLGGEIEEVTFGYGQLISEYRNTISVDNPKIGVTGSQGRRDVFLQGLFSSITDPGLFGARGAVWPFEDRQDSRFREAVVGATLAGDLDNQGRLVNPDRAGVPYVADDEVGNPLIGVVPGESDGALVMIALDAAMPLHYRHVDKLLVYSEVAKIVGFGQGLSLGLNGQRRRGDLFVEGWLEQRLIGSQYLPSYFNSLYEVERVQRATVDAGDREIEAFQSKRNQLAGQNETLIGSFIAVEASVRRRYRVRTSFERTWNKAASDWFHIDLRVYDRDLPYQIRFTFDRINMDEIEDIWNGPSENGIMRLELAYAFWEKLLLGFRFRQTFEPVERLGRIVGQSKQTRIAPNIVVRF
ncbi:MAG: hypothetical protein JJ896_11545 [Rhodothermales bacterium]|nr:hypothetical protein [Rhodothermales bacterium]MBO6780277.1 hypothetical protein [Rhodothermales bacterium]